VAALPRETSSSKASPIISILDTPNYADNFFADLEGLDISRFDIKTGIRLANADFSARQNRFHDLARLKPKPLWNRILFKSQENARINGGNIGPRFSDIYISKANINREANYEPNSRHITNNYFWPVRRYKLIAGESNCFTRQTSLDAPANCQNNRECSNNDGSSGSGGFRRPIHWDSVTFYTTLGGLLSFAAIYAGILLYISRDQRQ
jgi:hypothetical protein